MLRTNMPHVKNYKRKVALANLTIQLEKYKAGRLPSGAEAKDKENCTKQVTRIEKEMVTLKERITNG